jgi:hypothetical protein
MNETDSHSLPSRSNWHDMLLAKACLREQPDLEISEDTFSDEAVRALLDEWLVPAIVDSLIRNLVNSPLRGER